MVSRVLRGIGPIRKGLNLPSSRVISWEEWHLRADNEDTEVPLDEARQMHFDLPETSQQPVHWMYTRKQDRDIPRTFVAVLNNGAVWGNQGGNYFNAHGDLIDDLGEQHWLDFGTPRSQSKLTFPKLVSKEGTVAVLAHNSAYSNYAHWLFDVTPRLNLLERAGFGPDKIDHYLVGHSNLPFQWETLDLARIPREKVSQFTPDTYVRADRLILPYSVMAYQPEALAYIRRLGGITPQETERRPTPGRRLFVSRADASFRRLIGESELRPALEAMGFEFITLAGVGVYDTAQIFRDAEIVVGPFGSGLMNAVFCRPGTKLLEILGPSFFNCYHWYLSETCGLDHHYFMGLGASVPSGGLMVDLTKDIEVDQEKLLAYTRALCPS